MIGTDPAVVVKEFGSLPDSEREFLDCCNDRGRRRRDGQSWRRKRRRSISPAGRRTGGGGELANRCT